MMDELLAELAATTNDLEGAACKGLPGDYWYPEGVGREVEERTAMAKRICSNCPVQVRCHMDAALRGEESGIWGGYVFLPFGLAVAA